MAPQWLICTRNGTALALIGEVVGFCEGFALLIGERGLVVGHFSVDLLGLPGILGVGHRLGVGIGLVGRCTNLVQVAPDRVLAMTGG